MDSSILTPLTPIQPPLQGGASLINIVGVFIFLFTEHLYNWELEIKGKVLKGAYTLFI